MPASRDLSFGFSPPVNLDSQPDPSSLSFASSAPFYPLHGNPKPFGFSFHSCSSSGTMEFSPSASSTPNFSFFSPPVQQEILFDFTAGSGDCKLLESVLCEEAEFSKRLACSTRAIGRRRKRNHTIGMGELEQLDLMVSESVIRWASCAHLTEAVSLRSSLVC